MAAQKSTLVAYILCFFLGLLGAHKLYLRRPFLALLYLFTAGLFVVGWIIDLFTLREQVDICNDNIYDEHESELFDRIDDLEDEFEALHQKLRKQ